MSQLYIRKYFFFLVDFFLRFFFGMILILMSCPPVAQAQDSLVMESCVTHYDIGPDDSVISVDTFDAATGLIRSDVEGDYWTHYTYNTNNQVDTVLQYHFQLFYYRTIHYYNTISKDSIVLNQSYVSNVWEDATRSLYEYDSLGRISLKVAQTWNSTVWNLNDSTFYSYTGNLLDNILTVTAAPDSSLQIYTYDTTGAYTVLGFHWFGGVWDTLEGYKNYNAAGQILNSYNGDAILSYQYDSLGRLIISSGKSPFQGGSSWATYYYYTCSGFLRSTHYSYSTEFQARSTDCDYYYLGNSVFYVALEPDHNICSGASVQFTDTVIIGSGPVTYSWSPSAGLSSDTILNPVAAPDSTTTYNLIATDSAGNIFNGCVTIVVRQTPEISITTSDSTSICYGDTVHLLAMTTNAVNLYYRWYLNSTQIYSGPDSTRLATVTGLYHVYVTGTNGCQNSSDSIDVFVNTAAQAFLQALHFQNCIGDTDQLYLNPQVAQYNNYQWEMDSVIIPGATDSVLFVSQDGWYSVIITSDTSSCTYTTNPLNGHITFSAPATPDIIPSYDTIVCHGNNNFMLRTTRNPNWGYSYVLNGVSHNWYSTLGDSVVLTIYAPTYVIVEAWNAGCPGKSDSILVDLFPDISFSILTNPVSPYCLYDSVLLSASVPIPGSYLWSTGSVDTFAYADTTGWYTVNITDTNGCDQLASIYMTFNAPPGVPVISQHGDTLVSTAGNTMQWYLNGVPIPGATDIYYVASQAGFYTYEVTVASGCAEISVPYYFSPVGIKAAGYANTVFVYPTVATNSFVVYSSSQNQKGEIRLELYDTDAKIVLHEILETPREEISSQNLQAGIYFWRAMNARDQSEILGEGKIVLVE